MIYDNMGHNDIDYEHGSNKELSFSLITRFKTGLSLMRCFGWRELVNNVVTNGSNAFQPLLRRTLGDW